MKIKVSISRWLGAAIMAVAGASAMPTAYADTIYGVTQTGTLIRFQSDNPGSTQQSSNITGLQVSETVYGIDFRPATGGLYAVGTSSRQYRINPSNGAATQVGSSTFALDGADAVGVDFDPVADRLRVVNSAGATQILDPNGTLASAAGAAVSNGGSLADVAYNRSFPGTATTTLYGIDTQNDQLKTINQATGAATLVGSLGVNAESASAIDFHGTLLYAALRVGGTTGLYLINPASGSATLVGAIGGNPVLVGIAVQPDSLVVNGPKGPIIPKVSIKLNFAKPGIADAIAVSGSINIPEGFQALGQQVTVNVGGVTKTFTLDAKGKAKVGFDSFAIKVKATKVDGVPTVLAQTAKYKFAAKKGNFAPALEDEGLINDLIVGTTVQVPISINLGDHFYQSVRDLFYKASLNKKGAAK